MLNEEEFEAEKMFGKSKELDENSIESEDEQDNLCMIPAEAKRRDLTKELMKKSHIAQAHSTTYHPQTNGLVERQNRTLVKKLRVHCSRYMTDWEILAASGGSIQQHSTLNNEDQSIHDAYRQRKGQWH